MSSETIALYDQHRDSLRGTLVLSLVLHALLFASVIGYTMLGSHLGSGWGQQWGGDATHVGTVPSLAIPLPAPMLPTANTVVTRNTGLTKTEPQPKVEPPPDAEQIPKFKDAVKPEKPERINKRIQKAELEPPPNAIPYGEYGTPMMTYSQVGAGGGDIGSRLGDGNSFGARYGYYAAAMRTRISNNWLLSTISPNIVSAPRVYFSFEILRDGTITGIEMTQSSGNPEVDRSAQRAILASNPLAPLPADYAGASLKVDFYFDFHR
jgi:TonB family protein